MLKFEDEIADKFKKIYAIGSEIRELISGEDEIDPEVADRVLQLYQKRKPYFESVSELIAQDREGDGKIAANLEQWQQQLRPLIQQDEELEKLLGTRLAQTKKKLMDSSKGKSLMVYSKGRKK